MSERNGRKISFEMKKKYILVCLVVLCGLTMFIASCSKDEESKSCTCTESDGEGYSASKVIDPASFGASNCSDLALKIRIAEGSGDFSYSCN
jgi:hypothetical protein